MIDPISLFQIVPNLSEGRDTAVIEAAAKAVHGAGARLLHLTSDERHNRSVLTVAGSGSQVLEAAVALAGVAMERIDLRTHRGVHPRIGALDVLPFVPLRNATMAQAVDLAHEAGVRIWERYEIPSFYYGAAARNARRELLANVRAGEFEGLDARFADPTWAPDTGTVAKHERAGAIAIGARPILVAFNVELSTGDLTVARDIARAVRERDGGLKTVRALGLRLRDDLVQVSINVTSYDATPLYRIVELIRRLAARHDVALATCELVGCLPRAAVESAARYYLGDVGE
ncbi:MAG: glutamate formimidoyltransferase [Candidatus Eremiobacteraeota bacterium]|nr:glutamate formimidoyltransferase [Candidatus Eremiobacteraeota bacterium]